MNNFWTWKLLRAGSFKLDGGSMFGVVPSALWKKMCPADEKNRILLQTNCVLLEKEINTKKCRILIETGYGTKWSKKDRDIFNFENRSILNALDEEDIDPSSINHVFLTHLHFDHAAGLTVLSNKDDIHSEVIPAFPEAKIWIQNQEWIDAINNKSTMSKTYLENHLKPVQKQIQIISGESYPLGKNEKLYVKPVPGHTWGQQAIFFEDKDGTVVFPGDLLPTKNHVGLAFSMGYDMLPYENMLTKKNFLNEAHKKNWRIILDHEPENPIFVVEKNLEKNKFKLISC